MLGDRVDHVAKVVAERETLSAETLLDIRVSHVFHRV